MTTVVLVSTAAPERVRQALSRALDRLPARVEAVADDERLERMHRVAAEGADWLVLVDADAVLLPTAFGALNRALAEGPALVGGRSMVHGAQRFGWMFGASRSGPDPFELVPITGFTIDRHALDAIRGPIDVPQRGVLVVDGGFVRSLDGLPMDARIVHLELAIAARDAGYRVWCEPSLGFSAEEERAATVEGLLQLRRFAAGRQWDPERSHRDPVALRAQFIHRETRAAGNVRGYLRRAWPALDVVAASDVAALRAALARTGDRYVLVSDGSALPARADVIELVERLERSGRRAVALAGDTPPYGTALFHCGRLISGSIDGATTQALIANAIARLPRDRLFAASAAGDLVPPILPPLAPLRSVDAILVAAAKPEATQQTVRPLVMEPVDGTTTVVYPAGLETTTRLLAVYDGLHLEADESDPQLAVGLNRVLGRTAADGVLIVRDDAQLPRGVIARLRAAFTRLPRLGAVVPRVTGIDRPEGLNEVEYGSVAEMQEMQDRRAVAYAREATLMDFATAPVMLVSRRALQTVGGFDETFGFSCYGIADFTRRLRAANFLVARCDDTYAHLFPPGTAGSLLADLDDAAALKQAYNARWARRTGFDPATDRVAFEAQPAGNSSVANVRILIPIASDDEWRQLRPYVAGVAALFRASDPVEVAIGLEGEMPLVRVLAGVREDLVQTGISLAETVNVRIERIVDVDAWRDAAQPAFRFAATDRAALSSLPAIASAAAIRDLFAAPVA